MAWTACEFGRGRIDDAGHKLIALEPLHPERDLALDVINNWRSCHSYPLHIITNTLLNRARQVNQNALVARRTKRLPSIALKLRQNANMKLSQMQDIGGCRAVLNSVAEVERLAKAYRDATKKHPDKTDRSFLLKEYDYIEHPKQDGYRGIHLIMKYQSKEKPASNGQRIEIQLRSKLQHAWATAVETCQTFTGQALKSKIKSAQDTWLRFVSIMSTAIAVREKRPIVPDTPHLKAERKAALADLEKQENVISLLQSWSNVMQHQTISDDHESEAFLLELNIAQKLLSVTTFKENEVLLAHAQYLAREKATESDQNVQVVLVSADSVANLKRAYPNFYVDTTAFIHAIRQEID